MKLGISIVICTYNGEKRLPETLSHLSQLKVRPDVAWEVLVIDNASTDNTSRVAMDVWERQKCTAPFSLLYQPNQGLTYAREMALKEAKHTFILFCDDDNWLDENYLNIAYDLMVQHPEIGVLGGQGELEYEVEPPYWVAKFPKYANGKQAKQSGKVPTNAVYGAGFVLRKSAYDNLLQAGFRPLLTDRLAGNLSSGGDYELCYALALAGYTIWYDERLLFKHYITKDRIDWNYYIQFFDEGSECYEVLVPYQIIMNNGSSTVLSFQLRLLQRFLRQFKIFLAIAAVKFVLPANSVKGKLFLLKFLSLKKRLLSYRKYHTMKAHFTEIIRFKQENLVLLEKQHQYTSKHFKFEREPRPFPPSAGSKSLL